MACKDSREIRQVDCMAELPGLWREQVDGRVLAAAVTILVIEMVVEIAKQDVFVAGQFLCDRFDVDCDHHLPDARPLDGERTRIHVVDAAQ